MSITHNPGVAVSIAAPTHAQWLTDTQQRAWRSYLRGGRLLNDALDRDMQEHGVQLSEYEIISMLSEVPGAVMRMSALAEIVIQSRSRLSHTAARLEERGWVQRRPAVGDRRGVELSLTPEGIAAVARLAPIHVASVRARFLDFLSNEDFEALGTSMETVRLGLLTGKTDRIPPL